MTLGAVDHVDSMLADSEDEAMAKVAQHTRVSESPDAVGQAGTGMFKLPDCSRSPWRRIAVFLGYRRGKLPAIGTYNHIVTVLAPATPELYQGGPTGHPDGAYVYELTGTAVEFMAHATVMGRTISRPKVTDMAGSAFMKNTKFVYIGFSSCKKGLMRGTEESTEWTQWEEKSGIAFPHPWSHSVLELRLRHDEIFKIQRKVGAPFKAALNALFPQSKNRVGQEGHKRYNFATFNCGHYARELLTAAFGMEEKDAQKLMLDDLSPLSPKMEHAQPLFICEPVND